MSRRAIQLFSGLFILTQFTLASVGVWSDAQQELAVFTADVHVESPSDGCVPAHDHRLCVLCRVAHGIKPAAVSLPIQPVVAIALPSGTSLWDGGLTAPATQPPPRGPPVST